ncbi:efflux RND transporter periplasmic adaptor subunit [bacterium]|uniref:Efflux RND transporter periplasmic adaptor subunit n=1 Tax=Candidatus Scatenecus faecavium TaxID=2840915 RepID=A0A9D1K3D1_9BACT|nr:efflux RND transporter periplasmic adaptor subunit [bacterium]HIS82810.1 efflux RND transporter periplasmic adaptor subunit [Candidatus Scatenecus faecavium]
MKINLTRKHWAVIILLVIIVPIIYNKSMSLIAGFMQQQAMRIPKEVVVDNPHIEEVNISAESTGRVEAKYSVDLVARVPGFLMKKYFNEGDFVKKGQLLFQIDPREYQLEVNNSQATVNQYSALLKNAQQELNRANALVKEDLISRSDVDQSLATRNQNKALLDAARQQLELAKVNLSYTSVKSPIDGRIGKVNITEGNYVTANSGGLVNVSSVNPVYVSFSLKSDEFVKLLKASDQFKDVKVQVQFSGGSWYDKIGTVNFIDNKIDKNSGSVEMRATFDNSKMWLIPGDYMKVKLTAPKKVKFVTIPQSCTKGDAMSGYYVWVVEDNKAVRKDIKVSDNINNNWVVNEGLLLSDKVVISGIQSIMSEGQKLKIIEKSQNTENTKKAAGEN